ncbi:MAG: hypothetical protein U1G07_06705 [Verrucomicrobiota bacterium]
MKTLASSRAAFVGLAAERRANEDGPANAVEVLEDSCYDAHYFH